MFDAGLMSIGIYEQRSSTEARSSGTISTGIMVRKKRIEGGRCRRMYGFDGFGSGSLLFTQS